MIVYIPPCVNKVIINIWRSTSGVNGCQLRAFLGSSRRGCGSGWQDKTLFCKATWPAAERKKAVNFFHTAREPWEERCEPILPGSCSAGESWASTCRSTIRRSTCVRRKAWSDTEVTQVFHIVRRWCRSRVPACRARQKADAAKMPPSLLHHSTTLNLPSILGVSNLVAVNL